MGRPRAKNINVTQRAEEFIKDGMYVFDRKKQVMMCQWCNVRVCWERRSTVLNHCESDGHKSKKALAAESTNRMKRQMSVDDALDKAKKMKVEKEEFICDTVSAFLKSNIPLEKLDNEDLKKWINKHIKGKVAAIKN
ncbi:PREDICTED: CGG triplet repeat-binding protein 1-like [Vollenhovia emeryi]|uniref:CGG triplet repeat-binding protein 1-like n=1 Tax=Vollenhovia emeryi TaxID=411798 RepID=UPI0005F399B9|nr:PREDICTED: CGG triplet repeat-binding protein 1-like [Vollenhovia emeryi]